ncbi:hypothetical protein E2542_SST28271 [Spatholobus suberectus]|nr:hypothetical protein E2542_SST28271 [Spatholobus suberectus]
MATTMPWAWCFIIGSKASPEVDSVMHNDQDTSMNLPKDEVNSHPASLGLSSYNNLQATTEKTRELWTANSSKDSQRASNLLPGYFVNKTRSSKKNKRLHPVRKLISKVRARNKTQSLLGLITKKNWSIFKLLLKLNLQALVMKDNPVGTGYSFTEDSRLFVKTDKEATINLATLWFEQFYNVFTNLGGYFMKPRIDKATD